jgi:hypothetical protein
MTENGSGDLPAEFPSPLDDRFCATARGFAAETHPRERVVR